MKDTGKAFIEYTKYQHTSENDQSKGIKPPPAELGCSECEKIIRLPKPETIKLGDMTVRKAIENRKTLRQYSDEVLALDELSFLLWCTQGVRELVVKKDMKVTFRNVPSAGSRHAFETYLLINRVEGLQPGLYRYLALDHNIAEVNMQPDLAEYISAACLGQGSVKYCNVTFIWAAVPYRMTWRYVERGYRYLFLDAGHVCQNLYISAEAIDCGVCAIGAYNDDELNNLLGMDGEGQFVIYAAALGKK